MVSPAPSYHLAQQIPDQREYKRTKKGCLTCRDRHIKCDETHLSCRRCQRTSRVCSYSLPVSSQKAGRQFAIKPRSVRPRSQSVDLYHMIKISKYNHPRITVNEELSSTQSVCSLSSLSSGLNFGPSPPTVPKEQALQKSSIKQAPKFSFIHNPTESPRSFKRMDLQWASSSHTTLDLLKSSHPSRFLHCYLEFYHTFISHEHFFLRSRSEYFIRNSIMDLALWYSPLLYALVSFSAYHHTLRTPEGELCNFFECYNEALALLGNSLRSGEPRTEATLCTVLILATLEEYLGDYVNLINHHQAAHSLVREILTPDSSNSVELHTDIFLWYTHLDILVGLIRGTEVSLSREWYVGKEKYDARQAALDPDDLAKQLASVVSMNRRFGMEMVSLYAEMTRGVISSNRLIEKNDQLDQLMTRAKSTVEHHVHGENMINSCPNQQSLAEKGIVDSGVSCGQRQDMSLEVKYTWIDLLSTEMTFKYLKMLFTKQPLRPELQELASQQYQLLEAFDRCPINEERHCIAIKDSIGIITIFLPHENQHQSWSRRKLAMIEKSGCVVAPRFRGVIAAIWQVPELKHWWLPNDEGFSDIIRQVRALSTERTK